MDIGTECGTGLGPRRGRRAPCLRALLTSRYGAEPWRLYVSFGFEEAVTTHPEAGHRADVVEATAEA
jgi:hypothetical protein